MNWFNDIDWNKVFFCWLAFEQALANSKSIKANSTLELVCNIMDTVIEKVAGRTTIPK